MPELPEVETIARDVHARAAGRAITAVHIARRDILAPGTSASRLTRALRGRRLESVGRRGKNVVLRFDGGWRLVVNLGMTGRIVVSDAPIAGQLGHIAARFGLDDGRALLYDDARRFGRLDLRDPEGFERRSAELGLEPLGDAFTAQWLHHTTRGSRVPLRNWLLDQHRVAGIGNIYANEALFRAGVRPTRRAHRLTRAEAARLRNAIRDVLREAIRDRGTTLSDYRDAGGERGAFQFRLRVYDRAAEPCVRCGRAVRRVVLSNRSAFYCPGCQR
ncbi:MAG: bifunctional DNA-formamidopyrimidine glycosylase/DNA-(apurinic or apyrimidinic site) lyase [Gemmatimonadetes bacterium]|nr:bifunctional DNA-formamidopyrimidine glycosylase/DNA-(apurinic or apyrimidinic site) lyase [Gemmatimonadota bacterium]